MDERWLNEHEVVRITGKGVQTLRNERWAGRGIPYYKVGPGGKSVRYKLSDVLGYMEAGRVETRTTSAAVEIRRDVS